MKIIFIAPLPPPITGHSLASKVLHDELLKNHKVDVVNLSKDSFASGMSSFARIIQIIGIFKEVWRKKRGQMFFILLSLSQQQEILKIFLSIYYVTKV